MHAALAFAVEHPALIAEWERDSNTIVSLAVPDLWTLLELHAKCGLVTLFTEPDLRDEPTSMALFPDAAFERRHLSQLPLLLKGGEIHGLSSQGT